jgi:hypothetical protein
MAFRSVASVLVSFVRSSLRTQGRTVTGAPAPPFGAAGTDAAAWWTRRSRPAWGHIGATPDGSARDNRGQRRSVVAPGQRLYPRSGAGRPDTPVLPRTEEARNTPCATSRLSVALKHLQLVPRRHKPAGLDGEKDGGANRPDGKYEHRTPPAWIALAEGSPVDLPVDEVSDVKPGTCGYPFRPDRLVCL